VADQEAVSATLAAQIASLLTDAATPYATRVFPGWPVTSDLERDLRAGAAQVSVFAMPGASSNVTRHEPNWKLFTPSVVTTTFVATGGRVTFGGTITFPLNVRIGTAHYSAQPGDTLSDVARGVAQGLGAAWDGPSVITDLTDVQLGGKAVLTRESFRTKQVFMISVWAPSQAARMAVTRAFQGNLFGTPRLSLDDGTTGILLFQREGCSDHSEIQGLYRRDIYASVEFSVLEFADAWDVLIAHELPLASLQSVWNVVSTVAANLSIEHSLASVFTANATINALATVG
jgi:hypothetical protein